jgi:hypothetical protein
VSTGECATIKTPGRDFLGSPCVRLLTTMKYCPKCAAKYDDEELKFCLKDGEPLPKADREAETVRMIPDDQVRGVVPANVSIDSPRVEYVVKKVWVDEGSHFDFKANTNAIRIRVKGIVEETFGSDAFEKRKEHAAKIEVGVSGIGRVYAGVETIQVGVAEFLVPVKRIAEEERSLFSFYAEQSIALLFRILVEQINTHHRRVELNIAYLWYGGGF